MKQANALAPLLIVVLSHVTFAQDSVVGKWLPGFNHLNNHTNTTYQWPTTSGYYSSTYNAMHMVLIPKPTPKTANSNFESFQGWVMVWNHPFKAWTGDQEWSIFDPEAPSPVFYNFTLKMPDTTNLKVNLHCSGHAWTKHGNLFVAGGPRYNKSTGVVHGNKLVYIWDPAKWDLPNPPQAWTGGGTNKRTNRWPRIDGTRPSRHWATTPPATTRYR
jgi:hypothetical protein